MLLVYYLSDIVCEVLSWAMPFLIYLVHCCVIASIIINYHLLQFVIGDFIIGHIKLMISEGLTNSLNLFTKIINA